MGTLPYKNQGNMVDTTIYSVYGPAKNLNTVGWIMDILSFIIIEDFFLYSQARKSEGKGIVI